MADKIVLIPGVLEKHLVALADGDLIQQPNQLAESGFLQKGSPGAGDVADLFQAQGVGGHGAVDIGLDGVAEDDVRLQLLHHLFVLPHQLQILCRVHAPAGHGRVDHGAAQVFKIAVPLIIRRGDVHPVPRSAQPGHQLPAEGVDGDVVVGKNENGFRHIRPSSAP